MRGGRVHLRRSIHQPTPQKMYSLRTSILPAPCPIPAPRSGCGAQLRCAALPRSSRSRVHGPLRRITRISAAASPDDAAGAGGVAADTNAGGIRQGAASSLDEQKPAPGMMKETHAAPSEGGAEKINLLEDVHSDQEDFNLLERIQARIVFFRNPACRHVVPEPTFRQCRRCLLAARSVHAGAGDEHASRTAQSMLSVLRAVLPRHIVWLWLNASSDVPCAFNRCERWLTKITGR